MKMCEEQKTLETPKRGLWIPSASEKKNEKAEFPLSFSVFLQKCTVVNDDTRLEKMILKFVHLK